MRTVRLFIILFILSGCGARRYNAHDKAMAGRIMDELKQDGGVITRREFNSLSESLRSDLKRQSEHQYSAFSKELDWKCRCGE